MDVFTELNLENINKLIELRKCLFNYQELLNQSKIAPSNKKKIIEYYSKDNLGDFIHQQIINIIQSHEFDNLEILDLIFKKDPYYYEESKKKQRDVNILKNINFKSIQDDKFFDKFMELKLDSIFGNQLSEYFKYIFNLINDIFDFELLYKLFNIEKLSEKAVN